MHQQQQQMAQAHSGIATAQRLAEKHSSSNHRTKAAAIRRDIVRGKGSDWLHWTGQSSVFGFR